MENKASAKRVMSPGLLFKFRINKKYSELHAKRARMSLKTNKISVITMALIVMIIISIISG